jgi:dihydroneopterin aldolase
MSTTTIRIRDLALPISIGVYDWEKQANQQIILSLDITLDTAMATRAAQSDALEDTLDYATLEQSLVVLLQSKHFCLLEHLCATVATHILAHPFAERVRVEIMKPGALQYTPAVTMIHEATR